MKKRRVVVTSSLHTATLLVALLGSAALRAQSVNVTTWHNDIGRTGQNTGESTLTQSNVTENKFGKVCSATLDGMVYSQPLVLTNVLFHGQTTPKTIAYAVTQNDSIYANRQRPGLHRYADGFRHLRSVADEDLCGSVSRSSAEQQMQA